METKLARISQLSSENSDMVFTSIGHLINKELLRECHKDMDGKKAVGIDGITKEEYEAELEENLENLERRLKQKAYRPKPARRVEIPKENGKTRPLSIYCYLEIFKVQNLGNAAVVSVVRTVTGTAACCGFCRSSSVCISEGSALLRGMGAYGIT